MDVKPFEPGDKNNRPTGPDGKPMKKFEIRSYSGKKMIFIDEKLFDWDVDRDSLNAVNKMGPDIAKAAKLDIQKHFQDSISEFVGRQITLRDIAFATQKGWI